VTLKVTFDDWNLSNSRTSWNIALTYWRGDSFELLVRYVTVNFNQWPWPSNLTRVGKGQAKPTCQISRSIHLFQSCCTETHTHTHIHIGPTALHAPLKQSLTTPSSNLKFNPTQHKPQRDSTHYTQACRFGPHRMHCIGLLLQMSHVASVFLSVCWSHACALRKQWWTDRDAVCVLTRMGPRNHEVDRGWDPHGKGQFGGWKSLALSAVVEGWQCTVA